MKLLCLVKKITVIASVVLVITLADQPEAQAQRRGDVAKFKAMVKNHPWMAKVLNKPAAWLGIAVLSAQIGVGSVLAQSGDVFPLPEFKVEQPKSSSSIESQLVAPSHVPLYEAVRNYDYERALLHKSLLF